ncbi:hypothetical protein DVH05_005643 [Phytophthora capsici]|nr:hypothetical protein DVH05_006715 [Phytophthora capsici]KAG1704714.1 hypothetical protein DVH05_005643 [Phytophthora capsici]
MGKACNELGTITTQKPAARNKKTDDLADDTPGATKEDGEAKRKNLAPTELE